MLKKRNIVDSDKIGKMGFEYDFNTLVKTNMNYMIDIIMDNKIFDSNEISIVLKRFSSEAGSKRTNYIRQRMIYRLYIISMWIKYNKWLN